MHYRLSALYECNVDNPETCPVKKITVRSDSSLGIFWQKHASGAWVNNAQEATALGSQRSVKQAIPRNKSMFLYKFQRRYLRLQNFYFTLGDFLVQIKGSHLSRVFQKCIVRDSENMMPSYLHIAGRFKGFLCFLRRGTQVTNNAR